MDLEQFLLKFTEGVGNANFTTILYMVLGLFIIFWLFVLGWVWIDSGERTTNSITRALSIVIVLFLNIIGLIIYLIVRPKQTIQELYWVDLERRYLKYETAELGDCPSCGLSLQPGFNVCPACKYGIKTLCKGCQMWIDKTYAYCPFCAKATKQMDEVTQEMNNETMAGEINKSKEEAIKVVVGNKTKYVDRHGILSKIKEEGLKLFQNKKKELPGKSVIKRKITKTKNNKKR
jgi:hypothetical protein